jgi:hypothetical protein
MFGISPRVASEGNASLSGTFAGHSLPHLRKRRPMSKIGDLLATPMKLERQITIISVIAVIALLLSMVTTIGMVASRAR